MQWRARSQTLGARLSALLRTSEAEPEGVRARLAARCGVRWWVGWLRPRSRAILHEHSGECAALEFAGGGREGEHAGGHAEGHEGEHVRECALYARDRRATMGAGREKIKTDRV